jgi:hypothetical protein
MTDDLRNYEQQLLDYIERGGRFPQMADKLIERFIDPEAFDLQDEDGAEGEQTHG